MNKLFDYASIALNDILSSKKNFKNASKEITNNKEYKGISGDINTLIGCELRHHLLLTYLLKDLDLGENKTYLLLSLTNHFFLKRFENEKLSKVLKELNNEYLNKLFGFKGTALEYIQGDFEADSIELASLRFNVPTYLLKMWFKHFGKTLTFKTIKANVRSSEATYSLNTIKKSEQEFLDEYKDYFEKSEIEGIYIAKDKKNIHALDCYKNREIYSIRLALKDILNKIDFSSIEEMALYSGLDDTSIRDLYVRSNRKIGLHIAIPSLDERAELLRLVRTEQTKNINYFEITDFSNLSAHISEKQDLVVVFPASSSFDKISKYPDYLFQFKQDSFDLLIKNQKEVLKGMSTLVAPGGKLVYIVDTLNRKESLSIINEFLSAHKDFSLVEANQIFPFSKLKGTFYYAILEKQND